ncbi:MAG: cytochrome c [Rhodospirillaceae bacterium]|jgi:mono/diheme cytochrome c family protein|nr:cytochrome c [Rhodospirillaceae bacterium]MBT5943484.1 cytochrome c [Rhodospirillaceae bacterium]MBT6404958.1 cytochrome c [Rhodospirillaceae bacterium]MBT6534849.1 cytochrome c [Rhodospirillaceae bacterium]MBT7363044.1 cytochrome c [Rhodospirillaceae bacterium]
MSKRFLLIGILAIGIIAVVIYLSIGEPTAEATLSADPTNANLVATGQRVYASQCAACHGANLEGQANWRARKGNGRLPAPPHDASGHTWHHDDMSLFQLTKYGLAALVGQPVESDMPIFDGKLTDEEIWASLAYIKSRWPQKIRQRQADMNKRAGGS